MILLLKIKSKNVKQNLGTGILPYIIVKLSPETYKNIGKVLNMARLTRTVPAIRCVQSTCKTLFEVADVKPGQTQEVVCPRCGEHYVYPPLEDQQSPQQ